MATAYQSYEEGAVQLQNRLNDPRTAEALHQILDRAELLAFTVSSLDGLLSRSDRIADEAARSIADLKASTPPEFTTLIENLPQLIEMLPQFLAFAPQLIMLVNSKEFQRLLDVLSNPKTLEAITTLMQNIDKVAFAVEAVDGFIQRGDAIVENMSAAVREAVPENAAESMGSVTQLLPDLAKSAPSMLNLVSTLLPILESEQVQAFLNSGSLERLVSSGILAPQTLEVIDQTGDALVSSYEATTNQKPQLGVMGLLRAARDPDVQKALGFFVEFGKRFGKNI